jgi:hypothetical protein
MMQPGMLLPAIPKMPLTLTQKTPLHSITSSNGTNVVDTICHIVYYVLLGAIEL